MNTDVEVEAEAWTEALPDAEDLAAAAVQAATAVSERSTDMTNLTVLLADDAAVADLNARFRGKDGPTNVLSFPSPANADGHLGDMALAYETCAREADSQGKTLKAHLSHLVAHGTLHLLGYDHMDDAEAEAMERLERRAMARLGLPDPYASDGADDHA